jgi:fucose permease
LRLCASLKKASLQSLLYDRASKQYETIHVSILCYCVVVWLKEARARTINSANKQ